MTRRPRAHLSEELDRRLRHLAVDERRSVGDLLGEAVILLLRSRGSVDVPELGIPKTEGSGLPHLQPAPAPQPPAERQPDLELEEDAEGADLEAVAGTRAPLSPAAAAQTTAAPDVVGNTLSPKARATIALPTPDRDATGCAIPNEGTLGDHRAEAHPDPLLAAAGVRVRSP